MTVLLVSVSLGWGGCSGVRRLRTPFHRHREFAQCWHDTLIANGVTNYPFDQAWKDYQTALLSSLYIPVSFHHMISSEGGRGLKLARTTIHRVFDAAVLM